MKKHIEIDRFTYYVNGQVYPEIRRLDVNSTFVKQVTGFFIFYTHLKSLLRKNNFLELKTKLYKVSQKSAVWRQKKWGAIHIFLEVSFSTFPLIPHFYDVTRLIFWDTSKTEIIGIYVIKCLRFAFVLKSENFTPSTSLKFSPLREDWRSWW